MKFIFVIVLVSFVYHVGSKATSNSESKSSSDSSSSSSSSEESENKSVLNGTKVVGDGSKVEEGVEEEGSLAKFDKAMELDGVAEGYTNGTDADSKSPEFRPSNEDKKRQAMDKLAASLNETDTELIGKNSTEEIQLDAIESGDKNETALGIDTFGAQGI